MGRGKHARMRRRIKRAQNRSVALGVNKAQDQTPATTVALVDGRIVRRAPGRRAAVKRSLLAAGVESTVAPVTSYELTAGSLAERKYLATVIEAGYSETRAASWPSEDELGDHGEVLFRDSNSGVFRLDDGTIAYVHLSYGWLSMRVASPSRDEAVTTVDTFAAAYPPLYRETSEDGTIVPITFWTDTPLGPSSRLRMIDSAEWSEIERNYTADVRTELDRLMNDFEPGKDGQLLLWQGEPGTGKTWALRALATQWAPWAEFSYITDPDAFFVKNPAYMIDVLLHESYESLTVGGDVVTDEKNGGKWRVLILEDTGELLAAKAKDAYGQGLSRLLNVVDGMVGQGLRVLAIVTTNDELGDLHPAVTRPGRCASQLSFGALTAEEASEWLGAETDSMTLAELYAAAQTGTVAFAPMGKCENCSHSYDMHDDGGACSADDGCKSFESADDTEPDDDADEASTAAADPVEVTLPYDTSGWVYLGDTLPIAPYWTTTIPNANGTTGVDTFTLTFTDVTSLPDELQPSEKMPRRNPSPKAPASTVPIGGTLAWSATLCPEGKATDDGRIFAPGSISWRELPLALMAMTKTADGHDGAEIAGRIDRIWREAGMIRAAGVFDTGEFGQEIARLVSDGTLRGVSVDIAPQKVEVAYRDQVVDEEGYWRDDAETPEEEGPSLVDLLLGNPEDEVIYVVREAVLGMATVCPFQAFADATIETDASLVSAASPMVWTVTNQAGWVVTHDLTAAMVASAMEIITAPDEALTASAVGIAPVSPPPDWFAAPVLEELTALTVTPEGRVYGHAAPWGFCHIGFPDSCRTAPETATNYAYFHLKEVECEDGSRIPCGTITLDTGHADRSLGRVDAARHYDDTGTAVADVVVGEDEYGIWVAGALRGDVDAESARKLRGASLSGDWRNVNGNLELVALLAVNVPGFPIPRASVLMASADDGYRVETLLVAGVHAALPKLTPEEREQFEMLSRERARQQWDEVAKIARLGE